MRISDWSSDVCSSDLIEQQARRCLASAPDPAAELVKLGEAETLGVLDRHDGGFGHVDPDLDDRGGDEEDRKSVVQGKSVSVRVDLGGRRMITKEKRKGKNKKTQTRKQSP